MSMITAAYSSYTSWSISQVSTATDAGTKDGAASTPISSLSTSVTTVSISYRAKQLLARASAERSVVDRLQALVAAFRTDRSLTLRGRNAGAGPADGTDFFNIVSGSGNDVIKAYARAT